MNLVILDIDGVLNNREFNTQFKEQHGHVMCLDPDNVQAFNTIIRRSTPEPKIILSSSWRDDETVSNRLGQHETLFEWLNDQGVAGEFIGRTPVLSNPKVGMYASPMRTPDNHRAYEIKRCLEKRGWELNDGAVAPPSDSDRFVVLEDRNLQSVHALKKRQVQPSFNKEGLTKEMADQAIAILSGDYAEGAPA